MAEILHGSAHMVLTIQCRPFRWGVGGGEPHGRDQRCRAFQHSLLRATALLDLYPRAVLQLVDVIVGGQYGSEGKGNIVGHIAPEYDLLVRVGGPNAGHKVYAEPKPETYHHLPSGTLRAPSAKLLLGAGAVLYPKRLLEEIAEHNVSLDRF